MFLPTGSLSQRFSSQKGPPRARRLSFALAALIVVLASATGIQGAVFLASDLSGLMYLSNIDDPRARLASQPFRLTLNGVDFTASHMAGATRLADGRVVAAIRPAATEGGDLQAGWGLYEIHPASRTLSKLTPLNGALSAIAVGPGGKLFGITFKPASLVVVNTINGNFVDLETFFEGQDGFSNTLAYRAGLVFDQERNEFLYLHKNHAGSELGVWRLAADGSSVVPLDHNIQFPSPVSNLTNSGGKIFAMANSLLYLVDRTTVPLSLSLQTRLISFSFFGTLGHIPNGFVVDVTQDLACVPSSETLCLQGGAYEVTLDWTDPNSGQVLPGKMEIQSRDSGTIWFVESSNLEVLVKVLDACGVNGHRWVFASASTDLAFNLRVKETATGATKVYSSPPATAADAITDTGAFGCS